MTGEIETSVLARDGALSYSQAALCLRGEPWGCKYWGAHTLEIPMSRAGLYGSLVAACAAALLVSCSDRGLRMLPFDAAEGPVTIDFSCNNGVSKIGLIDRQRRPAWIVFTDEDQDFGWSVPGNVTINSITLKNGQPVPINVVHQPNGGAGKPLDGKVQNGKKGSHSYMIDVTCRSGGRDFRLIIDPEMIVR